MRYKKEVIVKMPLSLRIPPEKEKMIQKAAGKAGKTKSSYIIEAIDEKLGMLKDREQTVRKMAGWLSTGEAAALRKSMEPFNRIQEGDWP
jgi:predicted DNA-binding protein